MNREQSQFQTIGDPGLVVNAAQVIFDDLLRGAEPDRDLLVLAALDDEGDDFEFLWSETVANAGADGVLVEAGSIHAGRANVAFTLTDVADALDEGGAGDVAVSSAVDAGGEPRLNRLAVLGNDDTAAAGGEDARDESLHVEFQCRRKYEDCATKGVKGWIEAVGLSALCNDCLLYTSRCV